MLEINYYQDEQFSELDRYTADIVVDGTRVFTSTLKSTKLEALQSLRNILDKNFAIIDQHIEDLKIKIYFEEYNFDLKYDETTKLYSVSFKEEKNTTLRYRSFQKAETTFTWKANNLEHLYLDLLENKIHEKVGLKK